MNIKEAKEQIKNAMIAYFSKDELGNYIIPIERQRPVFLMGAPGIGKTAIMEQIAQEMDVALLSYSMTHHTRQSALGLPFISHKTYGGKEYDVSEYTMSEIIASVYDMIEESGKKEGILFLDEINCVSETLAPIMLQFLQYKVFGRHRVPDGWIVVTAGNPPESNNSVRDFDIVTWDRLKRIDIEPEFDAWKQYAINHGVHPAVLSYLQIKKNNFYKVESTVGGKSFVTARGWDDLSQMIKLYEKNNLKVDEMLIQQYIQEKTISKDFAVYYDLFIKYRSDYQVENILAGNVDNSIKERAKKAKFDERLSLLGLLIDTIGGELRDVMDLKQILNDFMEAIKLYRLEVMRPGVDAYNAILSTITSKEEQLERGKKAMSLSAVDQTRKIKLIKLLKELAKKIKEASDGAEAANLSKEYFEKLVKEMNLNAQKAGKRLSNVFDFCVEVFGEGQELLILVTELTINQDSVKFIDAFRCEEYLKYNKKLLVSERHKEIKDELQSLVLD